MASSASSHAPSGAAQSARVVFWLGTGFCTVAAPWMLGGQPLLAQWLLLGSSVLAFAGGFAVRLTTASTPGYRRAFRVQAWALALGGLFVAYLCLQACNPSLFVTFHGKAWTLSPVADALPGPHSINAPFDKVPGDWFPFKNAWRYLLIYGMGWLFAAGLVLGSVERKDAQAWARLAAINGVLLALVCLVHRASGSRLTLWYYKDVFDFTASPVFFYKNHNGAYLALSLALVLGVAAGENEPRRRRWWLWAAVTVWAATVVVNSRAATGCATLWMALYGLHAWRASRAMGMPVFTYRRALVGAMAVLAVSGLLFSLGGGKALSRFSQVIDAPGDLTGSGGYRTLVRQVGWEMWKDDPLFGWGGSSVMYLFNTYHTRVPELAQTVYREQPNLNRFVAAALNCDWIEFLVEYGLAGAGLLAAAAAVLAAACFRWRNDAPAELLPLVLGVVGIAAHAYLDYVVRNPAVLLLTVGTVFTAVRLAAPRRSRSAVEPVKGSSAP